jgi:hypothetical protein
LTRKRSQELRLLIIWQNRTFRYCLSETLMIQNATEVRLIIHL